MAKKQNVQCKLGSPGALMIEMPSSTGESTRTRLLGLAHIPVVVLEALIGLISSTAVLIKLVFGSVKTGGIIVLNKTDDTMKQDIDEVLNNNILLFNSFSGEKNLMYLWLIFVTGK